VNPVIEAIKSRRSVRSYQPTPVPREMIEAMIDAGNWAPTGNNRQLWRFVVVEDPGFREKMVRAARPNWHRVFEQLLETDDDYLREYFIDFFPKCLGWARQSYEDTIRQGRTRGDLRHRAWGQGLRHGG
jgi:nitroreductase